jgi:hypothetical protein
VLARQLCGPRCCLALVGAVSAVHDRAGMESIYVDHSVHEGARGGQKVLTVAGTEWYLGRDLDCNRRRLHNRTLDLAEFLPYCLVRANILERILLVARVPKLLIKLSSRVSSIGTRWTTSPANIFFV